MSQEPGVMVAEEAVKVEEIAKPTLVEAAEVLSPEEVELAKKHDAVEDPEKKAPEAKKAEPEKKAEAKKEDMSVRLEVQEAFSDPEKEATLLEGYNKNEKGLYFKMKKENSKRQAAEIERDHVQIKLKAAEERAARLETENASLKTKPATVVKPKGEPKVDVFGNQIEEAEVVEDKDKPLTKKDLEDIEAKKAEAKSKEDKDAQEKEAKAAQIVQVLNAQQAEAAERYENFDKELELAVSIMQKPDKLEEVFPDKRQASRARKLIVDFFYATKNADKFNDGEYNAADIAHELATMHPDHGNLIGGGKDPKVNGGLDPEKANKIVNNAGKRGSSAALSTGSGKKFVPYEEMNAEQLAILSPEEFAKVPKNVRERILRGD